MTLLTLLLISSACLTIGFVFGRVTSRHRQAIDHLGEARTRIAPVVAPMVDIRTTRPPMPSHAHAPAAH